MRTAASNDWRKPHNEGRKHYGSSCAVAIVQRVSDPSAEVDSAVQTQSTPKTVPSG